MNAYTLIEGMNMRRRIKSHGKSRCLQRTRHHKSSGAFAVGADDTDAQPGPVEIGLSQQGMRALMPRPIIPVRGGRTQSRK